MRRMRRRRSILAKLAKEIPHHFGSHPLSILEKLSNFPKMFRADVSPILHGRILLFIQKYQHILAMSWVDWVVSCQTQVRLEQNYIDTHAFSAILDAKFGDSGRGICCDARSKWFTPQSWHVVKFEMSSACQVLHWYTFRCTPHNCNQQVGTEGNCPCFGAGKRSDLGELDFFFGDLWVWAPHKSNLLKWLADSESDIAWYSIRCKKKQLRT